MSLDVDELPQPDWSEAFLARAEQFDGLFGSDPRWVNAIMERLIEGTYDWHLETLGQFDPDDTRLIYGAIKLALSTNPAAVAMLVGTGVIEEDYFEVSNE